jgi:DNA mismatch endonuclease (patch repair protein)
MPKSRLDFWGPKLQGNRERDLRDHAALRALGWRIFVVWECQMRDKEQLENNLREFLTKGTEE